MSIPHRGPGRLERILLLAGVTLLLSPLCLAQAGEDIPLVDRINTAIEKGVEWLKQQQLEDGSFTGLTGDTPYHNSPTTGDIYDHHWGMTAFALFTLIECGVEPEDPVIVKGFAWMEKEFGLKRQTYELAAYMMALEARGMAAMSENRRVRNMKPRERAKLKVVLNGADRRTMDQLVTQLLGYYNEQGWRYGHTEWTDKKSGARHSVNWDTTDGFGPRDTSATQYALLGLKSALRCGFKIDKSIFERTIPFILSQQEQDGPRVTRESGDEDPDEERDEREGTYVPSPSDRARGFAYVRGQPGHEGETSSSMTTAGIACLILCKSELMESRWIKDQRGEKAREVDQAVWDGLAWLDANWTVYANKGYPMNQWFFYYLYGLERVGVLGELNYIGRHNWYWDGAEFLVGGQNKTGEWENGGTPKKEHVVPDTCFALLFLKKATVPVGAVITR